MTLINSHIFALLMLTISVTLMAILTAALVRSKASRLTVTIMITLMGCQLYSQISIAMWTSTRFIDLSSPLYRSAFPLQMASVALVYLYTKSLTHKLSSWRNIGWYHVVPVFIGVLWYFFGDHLALGPAADKYARNLALFIVAVPYAWGLRREVNSFQKDIKSEHSNIESLRLPWLRFLLLVCYLSIILNFIDIVTGPMLPLWIYRGSMVNLALLGLTYYGLKASSIFDVNVQKGPTEAPPVDSAEMAQLSAKLQAYLKNDSPFLDPRVRLADIAKGLNIKPYKLSEVINHGLNTTFYDLINGMRVQHAMRLMRDPAHSHLNLLGIAMDSGFNSKSVFNEHFKRETGVTPSEFRQNVSTVTELTN